MHISEYLDDNITNVSSPGYVAHVRSSVVNSMFVRSFVRFVLFVPVQPTFRATFHTYVDSKLWRPRPCFLAFQHPVRCYPGVRLSLW